VGRPAALRARPGARHPPRGPAPPEAEDPEQKAAAVLLQLRALGSRQPPTARQSDACLRRLLVQGRCARACVALATGALDTGAARPSGSPPAAGYALTHRLLFLLLARQVRTRGVGVVLQKCHRTSLSQFFKGAFSTSFRYLLSTMRVGSVSKAGPKASNVI